MESMAGFLERLCANNQSQFTVSLCFGSTEHVVLLIC